MSSLTETMHRGEFLVSEASGMRSREQVTIESGQGLEAGHVLGAVVASSTSVTADGGNTGDGTISNVAPQSGVKKGDYVVTIIEPATDSGEFTVEDPDGAEVGTGTVGTTFTSDQINFDLSDGGTDFAAGDTFTISVSGTDEYKEYDPANTDGSGSAVAILYGAVDATDGATRGVVVARDAEVNEDQLTFFSNATTAEKDTAKAELAEQGIIAR